MAQMLSAFYYIQALRWIGSDDIHVYTNHVLQLLKSENPDEEENYQSFSSKWGKGFLEYFESQKDKIMRCATRYNIEPWSLYNPSSGVTNTVAESLNTVIKRLLDWKEVPIDCLCLSLYYLLTFYFADIQ